MMEINLSETELQNNILKFGYGVNYKYVGMVSHSFDKFYVVTKFELPKVEDLQFDTIPYDKGCNHLEEAKSKGSYTIGMIDEIKQYCVKIVSHIDNYRKQIEYYNQTTSDILTNEIALMLPTFTKNNRQKRGIFTSLITGFVGLVYEGISSFLHHKRQKALQKAVHVMKNKVDIQCNKIFHLEDSMVMYGVYNTLEDLINTVHKLHNKTTWNERLFEGQIKDWYHWYLTSRGINHYAINSVLFLTTVSEKYVKMYERFFNQLKEYSQAIRVLSKGYLPITLLSPSKLNIIFQKVKEAVQIKNRDYDLVIKRLYLYYDMKLVTFGIDDQSNLIIQFPVFVHPHNQQHLTLYQLETVPVPIIDENEKTTIIHIATGKETLHSFKFRNIYIFENSRTRNMQKDWV